MTSRAISLDYKPHDMGMGNAHHIRELFGIEEASMERSAGNLK